MNLIIEVLPLRDLDVLKASSQPLPLGMVRVGRDWQARGGPYFLAVVPNGPSKKDKADSGADGAHNMHRARAAFSVAHHASSHRHVD
jgi:hypothetical protein